MTNNLNMRQFNDVYEMGHGEVGMVPTHALHDVTSAEYLVPAHEIPHAFEVDRAPHHTPESMEALTKDVAQQGVTKPISIERSKSRYQPDPEHFIADGSHRYLAALRTHQTHVPVRMYVHPPA